MAATVEVVSPPMGTPTSAWDRVAFRFSFLYWVLYSVTTQIFVNLFPIPKVDIPEPSTLWPMRQIIFWTAAHVFHITHPLVYRFSGSGDKTYNWVGIFCILVFAVLGTLIWSLLDRKRKNHEQLYAWLRLLVRFALASEMISYGMNKLIPLQMPYPFLTRWVEPFGNFTQMGVLWNATGASPAYEIFTGCAETLGGILLFAPRTVTLGALICLADTTEVFALNMTYDVAVKILSFHLLVMAIFLLVPDFSRLADFFFLNRPVEPSGQARLFKTPAANRVALIAQIAFGLFLFSVNLYASWTGWYAYGGGRTKSAFYGIWNVDVLSLDGVERSPVLTDFERWRRVIFDFSPSLNFQRMDDSFVGCGAAISLESKTIILSKSNDKKWRADFKFQQPASNQLVLDGNMDRHAVHMQLTRVEPTQFALVGGHFHWIAEYPFNRIEVRR